MQEATLKILQDWELFCIQLVDFCQKVPKRYRFTFVIRLEGSALEIYSHLITAKYHSGHRRKTALRQADEKLCFVRVLLRLLLVKQVISHSLFERFSESLNEIGYQLGGWLKMQT